MNDFDTFTKIDLYNVGDLGKITVATSFEWLPKVQKIAQSGHTGTPSQDLNDKAEMSASFVRKDCLLLIP